MIQRIQSVYLLAILVLLGALLWSYCIEIYVHTENQYQHFMLSLSSLHVINETDTLLKHETMWTTLVPAIAMMAYILLIIFSFKNRTRQIFLCKLNFLFMAVLLGLLLYNAYSLIPGFSFGVAMKTFPIGPMLFLLMPYFNMRTLMHIKRDEELVRSADRLR